MWSRVSGTQTDDHIWDSGVTRGSLSWGSTTLTLVFMCLWLHPDDRQPCWSIQQRKFFEHSLQNNNLRGTTSRERMYLRWTVLKEMYLNYFKVMRFSVKADFFKQNSLENHDLETLDSYASMYFKISGSINFPVLSCLGSPISTCETPIDTYICRRLKLVKLRLTHTRSDSFSFRFCSTLWRMNRLFLQLRVNSPSILS